MAWAARVRHREQRKRRQQRRRERRGNSSGGDDGSGGSNGGLLVGAVLLIGRPAVVVYAGLSVAVIGVVQAVLDERSGRSLVRLALFGLLRRNPDGRRP